MTSKQAVLPITGMTCANCVSTVEKGLKKVDGVTDAVVNLALERATVTYDASKVDQSALINQVNRVGYGVATGSLDLAITGMTCANCEATVSKGLMKLPGVLEANVNLATEKARVTYLPGQVSRRDMVKQVERIGYGVIETDSDAEPEDAERAARKAEIDRQTRLLLVGIAFSLPLFVLSMARDFGLLGAWSHAMWVNALMWVMATPVQFYVGWQYYEGGIQGAAQSYGQHGRTGGLGQQCGLRLLGGGHLGLGAGPCLF